MKIENFLILDGVDSSMTRLFKNNFVECDYNFGKNELERALLLRDQDVQDNAEIKYDQLSNQVSIKYIIAKMEKSRKHLKS